MSDQYWVEHRDNAWGRTAEEGSTRRALVASSRNDHIHGYTRARHSVHLVLDMTDTRVELAARLAVDQEDCRIVSVLSAIA